MVRSVVPEIGSSDFVYMVYQVAKVLSFLGLLELGMVSNFGVKG